ncbi:MAG: hypothetical protein LBH59_04460 [Planctomycetaceae bacterium]|nr:hypothetical protein [Planctomycetaceae bacterium]
MERLFKGEAYRPYRLRYKIRKLNTASVASRSVCSRAKPTAHTGFGILECDLILRLTFS